MSEPLPITIRPVSSDDTSSVSSLATQLGYPTTTAETLGRLATIAADPQHAVLVAKCRGEVVGWIHIYVRKTLTHAGEAEIGGLIVEEAYRGRGIGIRLVKDVMDWAREKGCQTILVRSNVVREDTVRFYMDMGFTRTKTQAVFRRSLAPQTET